MHRSSQQVGCKPYLAHSARGDCPPQTYEEHVSEVRELAKHFAIEASLYGRNSALEDIVLRSASFHDLGKLHPDNQAALWNSSPHQIKLPVHHSDAGSAALLSMQSPHAAVITYSHHTGLPNMCDEHTKGGLRYRDSSSSVRAKTEEWLDEMCAAHRAIFPSEFSAAETRPDGDVSLFLRIALSCMADADHTNTSAAYGHRSETAAPLLRADERLQSLTEYVERLGDESARDMLRREMYASCRDAQISSNFTTCDGPVGSGKTTAVMAHMLQQAKVRGARRIFVVLPYTQIIEQSADVYRQALTLPGENSQEVVAELHFGADFESPEVRHLTSLWRAPIIVTTAVSFFETLASHRPSALRRLHELPGSMVFIDEAHNALPLTLVPLAWRWMNSLADDWGCYWVLASGSLVRYWQIGRLRSLGMQQPSVSDLVSPDLRDRLLELEQNRVTLRRREGAISRQDLIDWVRSTPGPRLLIVNTVQSAAVIANDMQEAHGRDHVEHLSTALTPEDRKATINRIKARLADPRDDDWTLVATSCVEAGVDLSFRTGFRELSSLSSLVQASGRVNRHAIVDDAVMWSFKLQDDSMLLPNPSLATARYVLSSFFDSEDHVSAALSTKALNEELMHDDSCICTIETLLRDEDHMQFKDVSDKFNVIDSDTVLAVVDPDLAQLVSQGDGDWRAIQKNAVALSNGKDRKWRTKWQVKELADDLYQWTLGYDSFLGYMRGVLDSKTSDTT